MDDENAAELRAMIEAVKRLLESVPDSVVDCAQWVTSDSQPLGLLYATLTAFLGFRVNDDEYKVMGLASCGEPSYRDTLGHRQPRLG